MLLFKIVYTQSFPAKFLIGNYEFTGTMFGSKMNNKGKFTLDLCKLILVIINLIIV